MTSPENSPDEVSKYIHEMRDAVGRMTNAQAEMFGAVLTALETALRQNRDDTNTRRVAVALLEQMEDEAHDGRGRDGCRTCNAITAARRLLEPEVG